MERLQQIDKEQNREQREILIQKCLKEITRPEVFGEKREEQISGLEILNKLIGNIIKNPTDQKFRTIKRSNKTI